MPQTEKPTEARHTVQATPSSDTSKPGVVLSVEIEEGQKVEWAWTHYPDGSRAVTGYSVVEEAAG